MACKEYDTAPLELRMIINKTMDKIFHYSIITECKQEDTSALSVYLDAVERLNKELLYESKYIDLYKNNYIR